MIKKSYPNKIPAIAIVGRPNVGKSTLFNRLIGRKLALESSEAGTTRDWREAIKKTKAGDYLLMDTAGLIKPKDQLDKEIQNLLDVSLKNANLLLWVTDGREGLSDQDLAWQQQIRSFNKPVWLIINKCDNQSLLTDQDNDFARLGFQEMFFLSALHKKNILNLEKEIINWQKSFSPDQEVQADKNKPSLKIAIIGRPNVGKSSLLNALISQKRTAVSEEPGTTRDTIEISLLTSQLEWRDKTKKIDFADTAGIKRKSRITQVVELAAANQAVKAIERSDLILLVINPEEGITKQDLHIAGLAINRGKSILIVCNKWDLIDSKLNSEEAKDKFIEKLQRQASFLRFAPVIFTSVKFDFNIKELKQLLEDLWLVRQKKIPQDELTAFLADRRYPILKFITDIQQVAINPPTFKIANVRPFQTTEIRQLKNGLREKFELFATPIELVLGTMEKLKMIKGKKTKQKAANDF